MRIKTVCFGVMLATAIAGSAYSATMAKRHIGQWDLESYSNDQTGLFNHCAASAVYNSGIALMFAIGRTYQWSFGFFNPAWQVPAGQIYNIAVSIDGSAPVYLKADSIVNNMIEVPMGGNLPLFKKRSQEAS